ncbi:hypothetical protein M409DRAFT_70637 [Zasmidium cellare ATCC 36951]|uniref:Transcription factor domain-containing protein n=1 Tax=Zasmidium cellare ATCC 36951 TaxID=1080233 RepID=A0A6A6C2Y2_ZASCE|nr:uncharacterized protein M409DRAFT_70637 [Zasmidium cellare ATCC 36951]KAF2160099.1 hypothetical protein M409DRAFT_70637 [Zasmidium cellare ATCC 36951]
MRNFIENVALWADGPDPNRSFELEASRIAMREPVLKHAICAFSSRHLNRHDVNNVAEALEHQSRCLELLIPAVSGQRPVSDGVLAAVAILRQNEEMDEYDNRFHLEGVTQILNDASTFTFAGGLGEATAWLCLREDIYVSLTTQSAIRTNLVPFECATWMKGEGDSCWANRMILLLAKLLSVAFLENASPTALADISARISKWDLMRPDTYRPLYFVPRDRGSGRHLPEVWMLASSQAIGLQYYHIAQLVLAVSSRLDSTRSFNHIYEHRAVEKRVRHHLLYVVGIARSNERAQNTWFTAHHCLSVWGIYLRNKGDHQACLDFLKEMECQIGWRTSTLMERLSMEWGDDSE